MYAGLAIGGPLDGKKLEHQAPVYRVPELLPAPKVVPSFEDMAAAAIQIDTFEYAHYKTPGGNVWIPKSVKDGERYEHEIWECELDYIFSKLIRGYRPDGY